LEIFSIDNQSELHTVAKAISKLCASNQVFIIDGEMGAGKTTLVGEVCKALNVVDAVSSPTYGIVNTYFSEQYGEINHFDFYRIENEEEAMASGLDEQLHGGNICFVEWANKIPKLLPDNCVKVAIEIIDTNRRKITIHI
jgi:tRNA threonylcarbamoyladenosine biosynthesis protein TsaE